MALIALAETSRNEEWESSSVTETWYCDWADYKNGSLSLPYPNIGDPWNLNNKLICKQIKVNPTKQRFYSSDPSLKQFNGVEIAIIEATFTLEYKIEPDVFSVKISGSDYKTYKVKSGGIWSIIGLPANIDMFEYEYKLPISNIEMTTKVMGELNDGFYNSMRGKINNLPFRGRDIGTVLYDNFTMVPTYYDGIIKETELTLSFKDLLIDWNWVWRNAEPAKDLNTGQPLYWQNKIQGRADYTSDISKLGTTIWSGEIADTNPLYGMSGWDLLNKGTINNPIYDYEYANLNELLRTIP